MSGSVIKAGANPGVVQLNLSQMQLPPQVVQALQNLANTGDVGKLSQDERNLLASHTLTVSKFPSDIADDRPPQVHFDMSVVK